MLDIVGERRIGMVLQSNLTATDNVQSKVSLSSSVHRNRFMDCAVLKAPLSSAKHSKLLIGIETAVLYPATQEIVLPRNPAASHVFVDFGFRAKHSLYR